MQVDATLTLHYVDQGIDTGASARWQAVTAALQHRNEDIVGPLYGSFADYRACVEATVAGLMEEGLYDPRVESVKETAERSRALFAE